MKKAKKIFVRIEFPTIRVLKENMDKWHLHSTQGIIKGYEDEKGIECDYKGNYTTFFRER